MKYWRYQDNYYMQWLEYDGRVYYFWTDIDVVNNYIHSSFSEDNTFDKCAPIEYKDLPEIMKSFLKSIRFKTAMNNILGNNE